VKTIGSSIALNLSLKPMKLIAQSIRSFFSRSSKITVCSSNLFHLCASAIALQFSALMSSKKS